MLAFAANHPLFLLVGCIVIAAGLVALFHRMFYGVEERHVEVIEHVDPWEGFDRARLAWEVRHKLEQAEEIAVFEAPPTAEYVGRIR